MIRHNLHPFVGRLRVQGRLRVLAQVGPLRFRGSSRTITQLTSIGVFAALQSYALRGYSLLCPLFTITGHVSGGGAKDRLSQVKDTSSYILSFPKT